MNRDFSDLKKYLKEKQVACKKPVETEMYWWLNMNRAFYIGEEYKILLEKIDSSNKSVKIKIVNLKNNKKGENSHIVQDIDLQELIALHNSSDGE